MILKSRPRKAPWVKEEVEGDVVTLVGRLPKDQVVLNQSALLVWNMCDGSHSGEEMQAMFADAFPDVDSVKDDVAAALTEFTEKNFLVVDGGESALEYKGDVVRKINPNVEMLWHLEKIRQFLFGLLRITEAKDLDGDLETLLGDAALQNAKQLDLDSARQGKDSNVISYRGAMSSPSFAECVEAIICQLHKLQPEITSDIELSGNAVYLRGSHMGWHSNHSRADGRIYCSWAESPNSNFFRYEHPLTGETITEWEEPGWNIKSFTIPQKPARFWHSIGAGSIRLSLGFRYDLPKD